MAQLDLINLNGHVLLILFSWEPTLYLVTVIKRPNEIELYLGVGVGVPYVLASLTYSHFSRMNDR